MKAGVAAVLVALGELARRPERWGGTVVAHLVPDEEPGGELGAQALLRAGRIRGDYALVAEPSELRVNRAQKGNVFAALRLAGRAAHGSMPHNGDNAIVAASRLVVDLEERLAPRLAERTHPLVGAATLSVGRIRGGRATNVVADTCTVSVDRRLIPGETVDGALAELDRFVAGRARLEVENAGEPFETPEDAPLVRAARAAVEAVTGSTAACGGLVGGSDARVYANGAGIPTILVGPGSMDQAHVADEWVAVEEVYTAVRGVRRSGRAAARARRRGGKQMRILVVNPNTTATMTETMRAGAQRYARPGTEIVATEPTWGPESIEGFFEGFLSAAAVLERLATYPDPVDAVVLAGYGEPGLQGALELMEVPVLDVTSASAHVACLVAHRFGVVTTLARCIPQIEEALGSVGLLGRCAGIRASGLAVLEIEQDEGRTMAAMIREGGARSGRTAPRRSAWVRRHERPRQAHGGRARRPRHRRPGGCGEARRGPRRLRPPHESRPRVRAPPPEGDPRLAALRPAAKTG